MSRKKRSAFYLRPLRRDELWHNGLAGAGFLILGLGAIFWSLISALNTYVAIGEGQRIVKIISAFVAFPFMGATAVGFGFATLLHMVSPKWSNLISERVMKVSLVMFALGLAMLPASIVLEGFVMERNGYEDCLVPTGARGVTTWTKAGMFCEEAGGVPR
ncbi:hypothetical protein GTW25_01180 [Aliihoeflea aestuarii]|jgi:hypothetical protein|uniref:hypothetical protein n=1 Tax=Aliihoeflea aestuarii TaxID=453840 RepID=UPI002093189A|nr:hypothetical protein [Aliihoeflea aestuarii]MCO6389644.1 hypothetical protein [Aliihoeflea aestuarii]